MAKTTTTPDDVDDDDDYHTASAADFTAVDEMMTKTTPAKTHGRVHPGTWKEPKLKAFFPSGGLTRYKKTLHAPPPKGELRPPIVATAVSQLQDEDNAIFPGWVVEGC
jgi:hypothetical protein